MLIDEAHDFEPEWLSLAVKMVNPNTKAFLLSYDDIQAIYKGMGRPVWSQLGILANVRAERLASEMPDTSIGNLKKEALVIVAFRPRYLGDFIRSNR